MKIQAAAVLVLACFSVAQADPRWVTGTYRNPALGYSIKVPSGLRGKTGDQSGPERGIEVGLPSGGTMSVYGEPNSLEWTSDTEGIRWALDDEKCSSNQQPDISRALVGTLTGAKGKLVCNGQLLEILLVFRTGGGPIYWVTLRTDITHAAKDEAVFNDFAASFKLIRWQ